MTDPSGAGPHPDDGPGTTRTSPGDLGIADSLTVDTSSPSDGVVVLTVTGEVDMLTAPELRGVAAEQISRVELVVLQLDGVRFLGTSGLAALIEIREQAHRAGVELRIACTERRVLRPIDIAGLHHLFDIHDDVDAALNS